MHILFALIAGGSIGFLIAAFAFAVHDRWNVKNPADYQRGYEDGFREGRTRKELSEEKNRKQTRKGEPNE